MQIDRAKIKGFAKRAATPPSAAVALAKKRAAAKAAPSVESEEDETPGEETDHPDSGLLIYELVDRAAEAAEKGEDTELEDAMAGATSTGPDDPPPGFDPAKWAEAAEAVGLGPDGPAQDQFAEPAIVTAYLYKLIGGPTPGEDASAAASTDEASDMAKPGAAAKALARARGAGMMSAMGMPTMSAQPDAEHAEIGAKAAMEAPDPELVEKLKGYDPERDGNPPAWVADEATWERAKKAVEPKWNEYDEPYAVVAHTYRSMGGTVK